MLGFCTNVEVLHKCWGSAQMLGFCTWRAEWIPGRAGMKSRQLGGRQVTLMSAIMGASIAQAKDTWPMASTDARPDTARHLKQCGTRARMRKVARPPPPPRHMRRAVPALRGVVLVSVMHIVLAQQAAVLLLELLRTQAGVGGKERMQPMAAPARRLHELVPRRAAAAAAGLADAAPAANAAHAAHATHATHATQAAQAILDCHAVHAANAPRRRLAPLACDLQALLTRRRPAPLPDCLEKARLLPPAATRCGGRAAPQAAHGQLQFGTR
eukprot:351317-Chlamydomonas_euryale.AAC.5